MTIINRNKIQILNIAILSLFLVNCGTTSGRLGELPSIPNKEIASKVTVVRISSIVGAVNGYTVALDGKDIFGIGSGEYAEFFVPEGEHFIAAKCFGGSTPTWKEDSLRFVAKPSKHEFFLISPNITCAEIEFSSEDEARKHLEKSKQIDLEKPSK